MMFLMDDVRARGGVLVRAEGFLGLLLDVMRLFCGGLPGVLGAVLDLVAQIAVIASGDVVLLVTASGVLLDDVLLVVSS